jgi:hypothetical protein
LKGQRLAEGRTAEVFAWGENSILKLYREWCPASWADYEQKVAEQINTLGIHAPRFEGRADQEGRPGLIYERVRGKSMLDLFPTSLHKVPAFARQFADLHIEMHRRRVDGLNPLKDYLRRATSAAPLSQQQKEVSLARLEQLPEGDRLLHMDFHPGQVIVTGTGAVVLDWMTVRRGHPAADVARTCLMLRVGRPNGPAVLVLIAALLGRVFENAYLKHYLAQSDRVTCADIDAWMLPVVTARMEEKIANETAALQRMVRKLSS